jgi:hypothetical protein
MTPITLHLIDIYHAEPFDKERLEKIEHELTQEDHDWYDQNGWKFYSPENHVEYRLPSLGEPVSLHHAKNPVVEIHGRKYKVLLDLGHYDDPPYEAKGKSVTLIPTEEAATKSDTKSDRAYLRFFGQPRWVQNERYPGYKGKPCYHFCTIESGWGDSGNQNILIGCNEEGIPEVAYFEASCC